MSWDPSSTVVRSDGVDFTLRDTWGATGFRLEVDWDLGPTDPDFARVDGQWALHLPRPAVDRFEYQFTVRSERETARITDPANPSSVPNPFGDKSEIRFPEYREPAWLVGSEDGVRQAISTPPGELAESVPMTLWAPEGLEPATEAPLLIAHDGTDLAVRGSLLRWARQAASARPFRIAMLDPAVGRRDEWYAASESYADHFAGVLLPAIRSMAAVGPIVGMGASLGALSMLAIHCRHPGLLSGLALQSGSFFTAALDPQESGYGQFARVCAAVAEVTKGSAAEPVPVLMTCGTVEENRANNERMARALTAQGFRVDLHLVRDAHTVIGWRDAWSPRLEQLLDTVSRTT